MSASIRRDGVGSAVPGLTGKSSLSGFDIPGWVGTAAPCAAALVGGIVVGWAQSDGRTVAAVGRCGLFEDSVA